MHTMKPIFEYHKYHISCAQLGGDHKLPLGGWVIRVGSVFSEQDLRGGLDFTVRDMGVDYF